MEKKLEYKPTGPLGLGAVLIFAILALLGYPVGGDTPLNIQGQQVIVQHLQGEYASAIDYGSLVYEEESVKGFMEDNEVSIVDATVVGTKSKGYIARVEIQVGGEIPPDNQPIRFFKMRKGLTGEWRVDREGFRSSYERIRRETRNTVELF